MFWAALGGRSYGRLKSLPTVRSEFDVGILLAIIVRHGRMLENISRKIQSHNLFLDYDGR
jgi:hypothetical protein